MKSLARIPFWLWLAMLTVFCYGVWNPIQGGKFSLIGLLFKSEAAISVKVLVGLLASTILYISVKTMGRTLGTAGVVIYVAIVGAIFWVLKDIGVNVKEPGFWSWSLPFLFALLLAIGLQGSKIYRAITGRVSVEDRDTVHPDDHADDQSAEG
jgi:hypothetical protein